MPIVSSTLAGGAAGVSGATLIQTGLVSPGGAVTPAAVGALYQDLSSGALYQAIGATSADWVGVGGNGDSNEAGVSTVIHGGGRVDTVILTAGASGAATLTDKAGWNGTGNGLSWLAGAADGSQSLTATFGSTGQYMHTWAADGSYAPPRGIKTGRQTSGALPTATLASATGAQIDTVSDRETVTPFTGDGTNNAATCLVQLSPDNSTYSTLDTLSIAAALNLTGVIALAVNLRVPAGWYVKLTATHGTIGTTTYY